MVVTGAAILIVMERIWVFVPCFWYVRDEWPDRADSVASDFRQLLDRYEVEPSMRPKSLFFQKAILHRKIETTPLATGSLDQGSKRNALSAK